MALTESTYTERVQIVLNPDGSFKGAHAENLRMIRDGDTVLSASQSVVALNADALAGLLPGSASLLADLSAVKAERDAALTAQEKAEAERDAAVADKAKAEAAHDEALELTESANSARDAALDAKAAAEGERDEANAARDAAQQERDAANAAKADAESAREAAVALRDEAVALRVSALAAQAQADNDKAEAINAKSIAEGQRDAAIAERDALQAQIDAAAAAAAEKARNTVSPYQARMALKKAGLLSDVKAMIEALPEDDDIRLAWDWAAAWERSSPFVGQLGAALGLTSEQIDGLFAAAATF